MLPLAPEDNRAGAFGGRPDRAARRDHPGYGRPPVPPVPCGCAGRIRGMRAGARVRYASYRAGEQAPDAGADGVADRPVRAVPAQLVVLPDRGDTVPHRAQHPAGPRQQGRGRHGEQGAEQRRLGLPEPQALPESPGVPHHQEEHGHARHQPDPARDGGPRRAERAAGATAAPDAEAGRAGRPGGGEDQKAGTGEDGECRTRRVHASRLRPAPHRSPAPTGRWRDLHPRMEIPCPSLSPAPAPTSRARTAVPPP